MIDTGGAIDYYFNYYFNHEVYVVDLFLMTTGC